MADSVSVDRVVLRTGTREEVAEYLKHIRSTTANPAAVTSQLHDAVVQGSIPHGIFSIWMPIANDAQSIIQALRQSDSRFERHIAIRAFLKAMRSLETMNPVWNDAGGAGGVAAIMNNLSVDEIKVLCNGLAKTASLPRGQSERHHRLTELMRILGADASQSKDNPDTRPLLRYYKRILPACSTKRVAEHEETTPEWTSRQRSILLRTHPAIYETKFLKTIFSNKDSKSMEIDEDTWSNLINNNFGFGKVLLLRFLESGDELPVTPDAFMHTLAQPLTRRLRRRRPATEPDLPFEILELLTRLVHRHSALAELLSESLTGVIFYVVKFWEKSRSGRPQVEQHLIKLIKLVPDTRFKSADRIVPFLRAVSPAISYRLFQLLIQNLKYYGFHIDCTSRETDGSFTKLKGPWPASLFTTTFGIKDREASFRLFQRLMALIPDGSFLGPSNEAEISILEHCRDPEFNRGDLEVLQILLMRTSTTTPGHGQDVAGIIDTSLQERKKKASSSRDWETRAFWAISALNMSIASGSLDVYAETLLWARRFNKDPNTVKEIYASGSLQTVEGRRLLSGISQTAYATSQDFDAAVQVRSANKIMLQLLETASMALREPSFQKWDWDNVVALPAVVVKQRFRMVNDFQDARKLTDADIFDIVWQPSLELLVEAEKFLLRPGLQRLYPRDLGGLLNAMDCPRNFDVRESASKFVDCLAKARDELWHTYRSQEIPAVLALGEPWPRGLPVQCLFPGELTDLGGIDGMPYIRSRIENVVFGNPEALLQEPQYDKDTLAAIGPCVDKYGFALKAYVNSAEAWNKQDLVRKAWRHAVDQLSGTRMTRAASLHFWAEQFKRNDVVLPSDVRGEVPRRLEPTLPSVDDPKMPTEWHPYQEATARIVHDSSTIPATVLDQMLADASPWPRNPGLFDEVAWNNSIEVPSDDYGQFWDLSSLSWPISGKGTDAIVASLLLTLNTMVGSDNSILKQPFPSEADARYPALYLDQDFLETFDQDSFGFNTLRISHVIRSGPPELLAQVVESVLLKVDSIEKSEPEEHPPIHLFMTLMKLLASGDRPSLAFPFVRDVIINRPSHSSWHRELLNKGFFNTLPPIEAKSLLEMLSEGIQEKLDEQSARAKETREQSSDLVSRPAPIVKVTTVKMLVKLLSDAPFLGVASALEILVGLLAKAQHIDIRVAIIETLFDNLEDETASSQVKLRIISLLDELAVPLAASLNELRPTTEADWNDAEADGRLPEVAGHREQSAAPIRYLFLHLDKRLCKDLNTKRKLAEMTAKLVEQSAKNNQRWTNLFLKKHGFSLSPGETLPLSPVDPDMLKIFSKSPEYFNRSTFILLRALVLANIQPTPGIAAITKRVRCDCVLAGSNAGKHWLALYGRGKFTMSRYGCTDYLAVMHRNIISREVLEPSNRIKLDMLQQFAHEVARGLISGGDSSYTVALFKSMTSAMVDEKSLEALHQWKATTLPVLQNSFTHVIELRTPTWQRDPKRRPSELPSTFHLKVAMLAVPPGLGFEQTFVDDVTILIKELAENTAPYHENWEHLKYQVLHYHAGWRPRLAHLALLFGSLESVDVGHPTLVDHLRIDMAKQLLERAYDPKDKEVVMRVKQMLRSWAGCPVEEFRHGARDTLNRLQGGFGKEWFNTAEDLEWTDLDSGETFSLHV
ncbi:DNA-binding protein HEXBP [Colletotrichum tofieldiae]|nr:DNA-binding protein HEXBP [Colletotrichum tofieldiae]GKT71377.1 DNA-binding protein HEXBP [Colletotrichum tofieldiae]